MVFSPVVGIPVRPKPPGGLVPGALRQMGKECGIHHPCHFSFGVVSPRDSKYIVLLLQHGGSQPEPSSPMFWIPPGLTVLHQQ